MVWGDRDFAFLKVSQVVTVVILMATPLRVPAYKERKLGVGEKRKELKSSVLEKVTGS